MNHEVHEYSDDIVKIKAITGSRPIGIIYYNSREIYVSDDKIEKLKHLNGNTQLFELCLAVFWTMIEEKLPSSTWWTACFPVGYEPVATPESDRIMEEHKMKRLWGIEPVCTEACIPVPAEVDMEGNYLLF